MKTYQPTFGTFFWRITSTHMLTYFIMGIIASTLMNYKGAFENPPMSYLMKPIDSPWVAAGPVLQVLRGFVFSVALWLFRDNFLNVKKGWLKLWILIIGLSILSTTGATPGSIEGFIYTKIPVFTQMKGYFEVVPQTFLFSILVYYWYKKPGKIWNILSIILVLIIILLCSMGLMVSIT